jgi:hypothetical protein
LAIQDKKHFALGGTPPPSTHKLKNQAGHLFIYLFYFSCIFLYPPLQKEKLGMKLGFTFFLFFLFLGSQFDPKFKVRLKMGFVSMLGKFFLHT